MRSWDPLSPEDAERELRAEEAVDDARTLLNRRYITRTLADVRRDEHGVEHCTRKEWLEAIAAHVAAVETLNDLHREWGRR